jgi:fucose permease
LRLSPFLRYAAIFMSDIRRRVRFCHLGMFVIALVANLAPPLFIPLRTAFGFDFEQLGRLALFNFITQLGCILMGGPLVDRFGARPFALLGNGFTFAGLWLFAFADRIFPAAPYTGLALGTVVFSIGGAMLELVLSPIVNAVPSERKAADMSLLHAFYAIGQIATVLLTSLAIWFHAPWRVAVMCWSLLPLATAAGFLTIRIPPLVLEAQRQRVRELLRKRIYLALLAGIFLAGATEMAISQWISAYAEKGLGLPKLVGDLGGCCLFGAMLGMGRIWMGLRKASTSLERVLPISCGIAIAAYLVAGVAPWSWLALAACAAAGLGVSLLWPGMLSLAAHHFPRGGASMFAVLSAAGTFGCALAPWLVGLVADAIRTSPTTPGLLVRVGLSIGPEAFGLRVGLLAAAACPAAMLTLLRWLNQQGQSTVRSEQ